MKCNGSGEQQIIKNVQLKDAINRILQANKQSVLEYS